MSALVAGALAACIGAGSVGELLHAERFESGLSQWVLEVEPKPGSSIRTGNGKLVMDVAGGATAWLRHPLSGNYRISFTRTVRFQGAANDRVSDLNMFWAAIDPATPNLFTRSGKFEDYDNLRMYYAGIGGNGNTTTRLRRYDDGARVLLQEHLDRAHMLEGERTYRVAITVKDGCTDVALDGKTVLSYRDPQPLHAGYFGLRTTWSRQEIDDVEVWRIR